MHFITLLPARSMYPTRTPVLQVEYLGRPFKSWPGRWVAQFLKFGILLVVVAPVLSSAGWSGRYAKPDWLQHGVYFEGYELPVLTSEPYGLSAAPDGSRLAFAAKGWLWSLDLNTLVATRLTSGEGVDSNPSWSPDASKVVFVRDTGLSTTIVMLDIKSGAESVLSRDLQAVELDPIFTRDGRSVVFSSSVMGDLDLWRLDLSSDERHRLTSREGLERRPRVSVDNDRILYLGTDKVLRKEIRSLSLLDRTEKVLLSAGPSGQASFELHPNGGAIAYTWPDSQTMLRVMDMEIPYAPFVVTDEVDSVRDATWSSDGDWIYFVEATSETGLSIYKIPSVGGQKAAVPVARWDWGAPTGTIRISTMLEGTKAPLSTRVSVRDERGHPLLPHATQTFMDSENGYHYFFSDGVVELEAPVGKVNIMAAHGLTAASSARIRVEADKITEVTVGLRRIWDGRADGWVSGDHHFHLNYDGVYHVTPGNVLQRMASENLQVATPLVANLYNHQKDFAWHGDTSYGPAGEILKFGQEVRPYSHGHISILDVDQLYRPFFWGPPYPSFGRPAHSNSQVLQFARMNGGMSAYVHPILVDDPFSDSNLEKIPLELISDAVLGDLHMIEVLCLWSSGLGTSELWYRLMNVGIPLVPVAGTDAFMDFHRGMSLGTVRTYVNVDSTTFTWESYVEALESGRSFVTNGPILIFEVDGVGPGGVIGESIPDQDVDWSLTFASIGPVDQVEVLVNGNVVWSDSDLPPGTTRDYSGRVRLPKGGWIAARAHGGRTGWPGMAPSSFAHVAPIWIGSIGSVAQSERVQAAADLLVALSVAEATLEEMYNNNDISSVKRRLSAARKEVEAWQ